MLGLAILAVGVNVAWRFSQPALEPMPAADTEHLDHEIRDLMTSAEANVVHDNRSAAAWGDLGAVYYVHSLEAQSQVCFRNAERLDPADYRWPYLLAVSLSSADHEQIAAYRRAARRCGQRAHVQLRLAEVLLDRGELAEAAAQIESVLTYAPSDSRALFAKARLLFAQGKLGEAKSFAEQSTENAADKRAPYMRAPYMLLAQLCRRTHDAEREARTVAALQQIPDGFPSWEDPDVTAVFALNRSRAHRLVVAEELARSGNSATGTRMLHVMAAESNGAAAAEKLAQTLNREERFAEAEAILCANCKTRRMTNGCTICWESHVTSRKSMQKPKPLFAGWSNSSRIMGLPGTIEGSRWSCSGRRRMPARRSPRRLASTPPR